MKNYLLRGIYFAFFIEMRKGGEENTSKQSMFHNLKYVEHTNNSIFKCSWLCGFLNCYTFYNYYSVKYYY